MKQLKEYIKEKLVINKDTVLDNSKRYFKADDWTKDCLSALKEKFGKQYEVTRTGPGTIAFYKKGKRMVIKNLICFISGIDDDRLMADFGSNDRLEKTLGPKILDVIKDI